MLAPRSSRSPVKTAEEVAHVRAASQIAATVLYQLRQYVEPGVNTYDLDQEGKRLIESLGATSACYNYRNGPHIFPAYTCLSVNEEIVHGIGRLDRVLRPGDIITLDISVVYQGFIGDNAYTVALEPVSDAVRNLLDATREALDLGIAQATHGNRVGDISQAVQRHVEQAGLSVVREFVGHGVGRTMHEEPQIPNYGRRGQGARLLSGMTMAIEPMVNLGAPGIEIASDGWTALTRDRLPAAHFEHTVLVQPGAAEILTIPQK